MQKTNEDQLTFPYWEDVKKKPTLILKSELNQKKRHDRKNKKQTANNAD